MQIDNYAPNTKRRKNPSLHIANWNVQTMHTCLSNDLQKIDDCHKTTVINHELNRLDIDVTALYEHPALYDCASIKGHRENSHPLSIYI